MSIEFDIVGFGELLIDFTPNGLSERGNTLYERNPGGGVSNLVVAASRLGGRCAFIGKVGNDMFGRFLYNTMSENNVDTSGLVLSDEFLTTAAFVQLEDNGEREFVFYRREGADTMMRASEVPFRLIDQSKALHFSSLTLTHGESPEATWAALRYAKEQDKLITFDPNWRAMLWRNKKSAIEQMKKGIAFADIVKVSEEELELLTGFGEQQWEQGAYELINMGASLVIVTLGNKGCNYFSVNGSGHVDGFRVDAVDATGAGDSCFGSFILQFVKSEMDIHNLDVAAIEKMLRFSNAVAALCVTKLGGIPALPTRDEVKDFLVNI